MEKHFEFTDADFVQQFISCELDPTVFSHEAHLRLAWINIDQHGIEKAIESIQTQLKKFVEFVGATDKYNKTLTIASMKAVYHFMLKSKADNFKDFIIEFPQLKNNFKGLISTHYSFDVFNLEEAKAEYLEPDLMPFD